MNAGPRFEDAFAGAFDLPAPIPDAPARFAEALYGPVPQPPDRIRVARAPLAGEAAERLVLTVEAGGRSFAADAALWLPPGAGPAPLIVGLDFAGPAGILAGTAFPRDPAARIHARPEFGAADGRLAEQLRGTSAPAWPVGYLTSEGFAVLVACYGSFVPDDPGLWSGHGLAPLLGTGSGAISLWAWAMSRLVDAGLLLGLGTAGIAVAGHSRLGKAALWAAANDARIDAVLANNSGCCGAAPAAHPVGETVTGLAARFPHWLRSGAATVPGLDQHHLIAAVAPRKVYIASAEDDLWADPVGTYVALAAAAKAWGQTAWPSPRAMWEGERRLQRGALGHHLRPGGHGLLPYDWHRFVAFLRTSG